jgi:hypothetical protein
MTASRWTEVKNGFRTAGYWLSFMAWLALVFGSIGTVSTSPARFPPIIGWIAMVVAAGIAVVTMERWVRVLPGFLAYGVVNGLYMIETGHLVNHPSRTIARSTAVVITILGAGAALVSIPLASRKPTWLDRVAALGVFAALVLGLVDERLTTWSFGAMFGCLTIAWWIGRPQRNHQDS